ncbi:ABC transporter ATP-binding protein/permease [Brachybacterium alimentarium]|uniref:ABC transporter ATP-binding protein/permease n=1 Tax=Brachybacterium alimentarium TaxID=47845 RepID=UPI003FB8B354
MIHLQLLRLLRPVWAGMLLATLVGLALSALAIAQALATASLFSGIVDGLSLSALVGPFAVLAAALLLRPAATAGRELVAHGVASRMKRAMREKFLEKDAALGPFAGQDARLGERHALLVDGIENLEPYVTRYLPQVIVTIITAVVTVSLLLSIDPVVGAVAAGTAVLVPLVPRLWDRVLRGRGDEHWSAYSQLHADVVDSMRGMETLKLLGAEQRRRAELGRSGDSLLRSTLSQLRLSLVESGLTGFLLVAGPALALGVAVARVGSGALEPEALFAVALIGFEIFRPFRDLSNHWHAGYLGVTAGTRLLAYFNAPVQGPARSLVANDVPEGIAVDIDNVRVRYPGADETALDGLTLRIPWATVTAIVGGSGSGKSTVANVILGLLTPDEGRVAVVGGQGRPPVSLVSQDPVIFSGTLRENLAVIAPDADDAQLREALALAEASELADPSRGGLDAPVGDGGALLSGGQRQRVAIARALLRGSPVLILDEASSALDVRREHDLLASLQRSVAEGGLTVIVIAHRLSAIREADDILVVDDGRIVEHGTYDDLVLAGGVFARLHAAQSQVVAQ